MASLLLLRSKGFCPNLSHSTLQIGGNKSFNLRFQNLHTKRINPNFVQSSQQRLISAKLGSARSFSNHAVKTEEHKASPKKSPNDVSENKKVEKPPSSSGWEIVKTLGEYIWPKGEVAVKTRVLIAVSLLIGSKVLNVQVPILFKSIVDALNISGDAMTAIPVALLLGYGVARAGSALFSEMRNAIFATVAQNAIRRVATRTFFHLHSLDLKWHLNRQTGSLSRFIERGTRGINFIMNSLVFNVVPTILEIGLVCGILYTQFGAAYALVTAGTLAAYTAFTFGITQWRTKFRKQMNATENEAAQKALDSLLNYETVKYFNNEHHETTRYDRVLEQHDKAAIKSQTSLSMLNFGQNVIFSASLAGVMYMASKGIKEGTMTIGDLVMVNGLLFQLSMPLNFLGSIYREIRQSIVDMDAMFGLLKLHPLVKDEPHARTLQLKEGSVEFRGVTFGYNEGKNILKNVSLVIPGGKKIGLVGTSGSGKSTILRLLYRFYEPSSGTVLVDGQDVKHVTVESLRKSIAVIPQDVVLFNDTIYYNIAYGKPTSSEEEVYEAAKKAHIHEAILAMPEGYNTVVGERGLKLSGGEKQRVAIARAILKNSPILLCDEATSAVDTATESNIQQSLNQLFAGRTSIHIAHRLSTIADSDLIIVLGPNGVLEQGGHFELLSKGGVYKSMWYKQLKEQ